VGFSLGQLQRLNEADIYCKISIQNSSPVASTLGEEREVTGEHAHDFLIIIITFLLHSSFCISLIKMCVHLSAGLGESTYQVWPLLVGFV